MTVITKPTFSVDGWTANEIDASGTDWFCNVMDGWFGPVGVRVSDIDRPIGHGTYSSPNLRTPRVITLGGIGTATSYAALTAAMDKFNSILSDGQLHELVVAEDFRTLTAMVKLGSNPQLSPYSTTGFDWQMVLVAPDPRKYSSTLQTATTGLGTPPTGGVMWDGPTGGTGVQWGGPAGSTGVIWQTGAGVPGILTVTNSGTQAAPLGFVITDAAESLPNPSIRNLTTGEVISYNGTLPAGSTLQIDGDPESASVLVDGSNRGTSLSRAEFFTVPKQSSIQILFTSTGSAPGASLLVRWRDTYI